MHRLFRATGALLLSLAALAPAHAAPGSIDAGDLRRHVRFLAANDRGGRETGSVGITSAEEYVAKRFADIGLQPLPGADDYYMPFTLYRSGYDEASTRVEVTDGEAPGRCELGVDCRPFSFSDDGEFEGALVFAGFGISAPEYDYDDYAGLDVEGKLVLVLRHEPGERDSDSPFDGTSSSSHALFSTKARVAREHGALGMVLVTDPLGDHGPDDLRLGGRMSLEPREDRPREDSDAAPFVALQVSPGFARRLLDGSGRSLTDLQVAIENGESPAELALPARTVRVAVKRSSRISLTARNVVGFLEGSDAALKSEWIVVGAHHDHVGRFDGDGDTVFNGADDNASGVAGLLELAEAFATAGDRPRRSLVFATFSAEEKGLLGSEAMVEGERIPVDRVKFMFNLDMIGRNEGDEVQVYGDGYSRGLREVVEQSNRFGLDLRFAGSDYTGSSDHDVFYRADVPFMFLFTGLHEDYHQVGDHWDKLSYDRMESIVRTAHVALSRLAQADRAPVFIHHVTWLGLRIEADEKREAAIVTGVEPDSPGAKLGVREGDRIVAFGETSLDRPADVGRRFREIEPGDRTRLRLGRDGEVVEVAVERARVGYMGVIPAPVDEDRRAALNLPENEGILLRGVVEGGPSYAGGLREGDIVLRISGQPVNPSNLSSKLSQIGAGETVRILTLRDGKRREVEVTLGERPRRR